MRLREAGNNKGTGRRRPQQVGHQSCARQGKPFVMIETLYEQVAWHQGCPPAQPRPEPHRLLHKHTTCTLLQSHEGRLTLLSRCSPGAQRQRRTPATLTHIIASEVVATLVYACRVQQRGCSYLSGPLGLLQKHSTLSAVPQHGLPCHAGCLHGGQQPRRHPAAGRRRRCVLHRQHEDLDAVQQYCGYDRTVRGYLPTIPSHQVRRRESVYRGAPFGSRHG